MLEVKNLGRTSGKVVLSGIDFSVEEGYLVAVLGPNGVGKSTLFQTIMRPQKQDQGTILWEGYPGLSGEYRGSGSDNGSVTGD